MNPKRLAAAIVQEWLESSPFGDYDDLERLLAKHLKPLLEPWIPVTERLPNDAQKVLAVFRPGEQPVVLYLDKRVGKWADDPETGYYAEWPKYWMALPKAPESDGPPQGAGAAAGAAGGARYNIRKKR